MSRKKLAYYRQLERVMETNPHGVYVIQARRALRDMAREEGVELLLGDETECACDHPFSSHKEAMGSRCSMCRDCQGFAPPRASKQVRKSEPLLLVKADGEPPSLGAGSRPEDRWPHKYIKKYRSPTGKWIYVYEEDEGPIRERRTGFGPAQEETAPPPAFGTKRREMASLIKDKPPAFRQFIAAGLEHPETTQQAMTQAIALVGQPRLERLAKRIREAHPHITDLRDQAFINEAAARHLIGRHWEDFAQTAHSTPETPATSRFASRPGGFMPDNPAERQPWQLTSKEFEARRGLDPKVAGKTHREVVEAALDRREYVPWKVLNEKGDDYKPLYPDLIERLGDKKPRMKLQPETEAYVQKLRKFSEGLPKSFDQWVQPHLKAEGDAHLLGEKASGYNIDSYDVADAEIYSHMMTADDHLVMYHMYAQHASHGEEMLALMHESGLSPEYTVVKRASAVAWGEDWTREPELTYRDVETPEGKRTIGYSSDYILAFRARTQEEAEAINNMLVKHGNAKASPDKAIHRAWEVPDVRASKKTDAFERKYLNTKRMGSQELNIITGQDWIRKEGKAPSREEARDPTDREYHRDFHREYVYVNPHLAQFVKSDAESGEFLYVNG